MDTVHTQRDSGAVAAEQQPQQNVATNDGRAYGRVPGHVDEDLVRCGPGTPGGELLRRYWHPIAASGDLKDLPRAIRVLGEDLIIYRDKEGTPGLLYPRCAHRGTSLLYGKVEEKGIRCCYHGWLFDESGRCLEMPCEPANERMVRRVRQPWYPLVEKWGLIFAYLGPAEAQPAFPHFSIEDELPEGFELRGVGSMDEKPPESWIILGKEDYNWWQGYDNIMDPFHVYVLHMTINGMQFNPELGILPTVKYEAMPDGARNISHRDMGDGTVHQRITQSWVPNISAVATVAAESYGPTLSVNWHVPCDDTSFRVFTLQVMRKDQDATHLFATSDKFKKIPLFSGEWGPGKPVDEWELEDWQRWQCDYVAQKGQGPITLHSEEHLSHPDLGIALIRRKFKEAVRAVAQGQNPIGVTPGEAYRYVSTAGNALLSSETLECLKGHDGR